MFLSNFAAWLKGRVKEERHKQKQIEDLTQTFILEPIYTPGGLLDGGDDADGADLTPVDDPLDDMSDSPDLDGEDDLDVDGDGGGDEVVDEGDDSLGDDDGEIVEDPVDLDDDISDEEIGDEIPFADNLEEGETDGNDETSNELDESEETEAEADDDLSDEGDESESDDEISDESDETDEVDSDDESSDESESDDEMSDELDESEETEAEADDDLSDEGDESESDDEISDESDETDEVDSDDEVADDVENSDNEDEVSDEVDDSETEAKDDETADNEDEVSDEVDDSETEAKDDETADSDDEVADDVENSDDSDDDETADSEDELDDDVENSDDSDDDEIADSDDELDEDETEDDEIPLTFELPSFNSGVFTVGESGQVGVDFLFDGGGYKGEVAFFSLAGLEEMEFESVEDFITEAVNRAASNSEQGHIVISDPDEAARFTGSLMGEKDHNSGVYQGVKTVNMTAGDKFGVMLVPKGQVSDVVGNPSIGGAQRPLFSLATANPDDEFHLGQIADVTGDGNTFVFEDIRADGSSDRDYNDVIFQVKGATGSAPGMGSLIEGSDWRETELGQELVSHAKGEDPEPPVNEQPEEPEAPEDPEPPVGVQPELSKPVSSPISLTPDFEFLDNPIQLEDGSWFFGGKSPDLIDFQSSHSNLAAADTTNADQLWEGGGLGLELDGSDVTVGVWDGGKVRGTHQEMLDRVSYGEDVQDKISYSSHATHVAGTIIGAGIEADARGMASAAEVISYDYYGDIISEIEKEAKTGLTLANHSHGKISGWLISNFDRVQNWSDEVQTKLDMDEFYVWYGDRATSDDVSQMFGSYSWTSRHLDRVLYENPELLSVWSAGNDRGDEFNAMWYRPPGAGTNQLLNEQTHYLTYLSEDTGLSSWNGAGWYYLSASSAATYAPEKDGGDAGYGTLSNGGQTAKNTLVVGAIKDITKDPFDSNDVQMTSFSGWGSTDDGRIGVDLVANGHGLNSSDSGSDDDYVSKSGTSMAAPNATGTAALLTQHYRDLYNGDNPLSATLKGILLHTAKDAGAIGPDYIYGWGVLDGAAAAQYITQSKDAEVVKTIEATHSGDEKIYQVTSDGSQPLKATMVWTDPEASSEGLWEDTSFKKLVNDLDLWIIDPNGNKHRPWTLDPNNPSAAAKRNNRNDLDNVEQVLIDNPVAGTYTVYVGNTGNLTNEHQAFSLLLSGLGEVKQPSTITVSTLDGEAAETEAWEIADPATFVINRSGGDNSKDEEVYYSVSGTAENGQDYTELSGVTTIRAGQTSTTVSINPLNDTQYEELENVVFRVESHDSYKLGSIVQGIATIASNDPKPVSNITVTTLDDEAAETKSWEPNNPAKFVIHRSGGDNTKDESVRYSIVLRDKDGNVYDTIAGTQVIPAGSTQAIVTFAPTDDATYDGTESIHFEVTSDPNYQLGGQITGSATLLDNDAPPKSILNVSAINTTAYEAGNTPAQFRITRSGGDNSQAETVYYSLAGTAVNGADYTYLSGVTQIPAGETEAIVTVTPVDDSSYEGTETVTFRVQSSSHYTLGSSVQDSIVIEDNDTKPVSTITVEVDDGIATETAEGEPTDPAKFIIRRSGGDNSQPETVRYAVKLKDKDGNVYRTQTGVTTISAGYSGVRLSYTPFDDSTYDGKESIEFVVTSDPSYKLGEVVSGTATLLDNELPPKSTLNVTVADDIAAETAWYESPNPAVFEITRSGGDNSQAETVYYTVSGTATNGDDYTYLSGTVTIPAGETSAKVAVQPQNDSTYEGTEGVTFSVSSDPSYELGNTTSGTATILDNDPQPLSTIGVGVVSETVTEGEPSRPAQIHVSRTGGDNSQAETIYYKMSYLDKDGNVYRVTTGTGDIPAGRAYQTFLFNPPDDSTYDGTEQVIFEVTNRPDYKLGGNTTATITVYDDEQPPSVISVRPFAPDMIEGRDQGLFWVDRSGGDNSKAETVYYTVKGTAQSGEDYRELSGQVTIPAGRSTALVTVNSIDDSEVESTENLIFEVTQDSAYTLSDSVQTELTLWDDDKPELNYQAQSFWEFDGEWSYQMGDKSSGSAVDAEGNFYVVLGDYNDPKVQKVSPSGDLLWEKNIDQPLVVEHVAVKDDSLIIHSSDFSSGSRFSEISLDTGNGGLIHTETQVNRFAINPDEYDSVPTALKEKALEVYNSLLESSDHPGGDWAYKAIQDSEGNVYVTGAVDYNEYLIKVNANGSHAWTFEGEIGDGFLYGSDIEFASDGSIYFLSYGSKSDLLTKLSSSGKALWQSDIKEELRHHSDSYHFHALDMALDAEDKVHLFGGRTNPVPHYDTGNYWTAVYAPVEQNSSGTSGSDPISSGGKSHAFGVSWTGELTRIDLETGVSESLGSTGFSNLNSLTSDGQDKLLTIANVNSSVGEIIQIDPKDGTSQVVSTFNNNFGGVRASIRGLTHASDGNLYAIHDTSGSGFIGGDALFRIDPQTGTASEIATLDRSSLQSLAMAPSGKLYSIDMSDGALIEIDPNTGSSKTISAKGEFLNIQGLAFDDNGILYATGQPNSYTVDLQTGALTAVPELGTFRGLAFVSESQPASSPGTSNATTLYDITFDESSQALGQQPLASNSSNTVSEVVFGDPTIEQSSGRLENRPLVFTDDQSGYDQVKLDVGAGFDRYSLSFDLDPVRLNGEEMTVLLDTPGVRNIYFHPDGSVRLFPFGRVGTFDLNGVNQVETEMDFESDRWKLIVNGNVLYDGEFLPSSDDLSSVRFSLGALSGQTGSVVAIDNIQLKGLSSSSASTPPPVAGSPDPGFAPPAATTP